MAENDFLLSIIIPAYNANELLTRALDSIPIDDYDDMLEIIVIDDCSKTNQNKYIPKNKKIKYIRLDKNSGAGAARNRGIKDANGKYIMFVDADDYLVTSVFKHFIDFLIPISEEYDLIRTNIIKKTYKNRTDVVLGISKNLSFSDVNKYLKTVFIKKRYTTITICSHIYNRKLFNTFSFEEKLLNSEDLILFFSISESLNNILATNFSFYYHDNDRPTSTTNANASVLYFNQKKIYETSIKSLTSHYLLFILCIFY